MLSQLWIAALVFSLIGAGLILSVINIWKGKICVGFAGGKLSYRSSSLFRRVSFAEDLNNYVFLVPHRQSVQAQYGSVEGDKYFELDCVLLVHRENPERDVDLRLKATPRRNAGADFEYKVVHFAECIDLPLREF